MTERPRLTDAAPLQEYLDRVGTLFKLPGSELAPLPPPPPPKPPAKTRPWLVGVAAVVVFAGTFVGLSQGESSDRLPTPLLGAWGTTDPRYADRRFWIAEKEIAFQTGPTTNELVIHSLKAVRHRAGGQDTSFVELDYGVEGGVATLSLAFVAQPQPTILFLSQRGLTWTPAIGGTWPTGLRRPVKALDFGR